ncbi:hypothetical protein [Marinitoga aeolica]|uniref:DUF5723 domain-containing protein n=1 Tax=Marinitoga aeolica TaxID=2809031 RepID=A0ABY8PSN1_9BACT|nr:hypothetical protein [Marinitoga aeolica]WGS65646.1 hypothetical protein JRV97_03580 [Marinitoga aeolica]
MKKIIISMLILLSIISFANPNVNKPWNYSFNPALMDYGTRNFIDIGGDVNLVFIQPFMNFGDLFKESVEIDFNKIYDNLDGNNLKMLLNADIMAYGKLHIWFATFAQTAEIKTNTKIELPNDLIKLISYGNINNGLIENLEGEGVINSNIIFESSSYISLQGKNSIFGLAFTNFYPISLLRSTISFKNTNDMENAKMNIGYEIKGHMYSSLKSLESLISDEYYGVPIEEDILNTLKDSAGIKVNLGYINKNGKWGLSLNDIVLKQADVKYDYTLTATGSIVVDNMNVTTDNGTPVIEKSDELISRTYPEASVDLPMNITFFKTFNILFNPTPHIQYFFGKGLSWGVNFDGNLLFIPFWLDLSNKIDYWSLNTGFGLNLHIVDINVSAESNSIDFGDVFKFNNFSFKINFAAGI